MNRSSRGAALIIVLFIATILGVVSALLIAKTKHHVERITIAKEYMQAERNALSDLNTLIFNMQTSPYIILGNNVLLTDTTFSDSMGLPENINLYNAPFTFRSSQVKIQDMGGLIPLMPIDTSLIKRYLESLNWPQDQIYYFLDVLEDWQDNDGFRRLNGAESNEYSVFGYPLNQPIQTTKDIGLFSKVSPELLETLATDKHIIQFGAGTSSINYAPDELLAVMSSEFEIQNIIARRENSRSLGRTTLIDSYPSGNLIIRIESRYKRAKATKEIHILRRLGEERPFVISYWNEK
ncbi:hypothetical protein ACR30L_18600 [Psychromonas sp. PT13]|uniref:hypothetical protein n=1 Tax=Psychromonas sp. PT13 TaxID=3439547 RepID=UPI003EC0230A